jgi:hypothetical protein
MALTRPKYSQIYDTDWKQSVELATTVDVGNLFAGNLQPSTLDSVSLGIGNRILVKDQTNGAQNGLYVVRSVGTGSNGWWTRTLDSNQSSFVTSGLTVVVAQGTVNAGQEFRLTTPDPITLNTTSLSFLRITGVPGGANTQVQFADGTVLGGNPGFTFNKTSNLVNITGNVIASVGSFGNIVSGNIITSGAGQFSGVFNETTTTAGVFIGNTGSPGTPSPRIGFFNGNSTQNWQIDNFFGAFRWFTPGVTRMSLSNTGNLTVYGSILPSANVTYDLGSPTQRFRTGYFSSNTIDLGGSQISVDTDGFTFKVRGSADKIELAGNGAITSNTLMAPVTTVMSTTESTHSGSGAFVVVGGLGIGKNLNVGGNLTIQGNLFVNGNTTTINANNLVINDSLIFLADNNPADTLDIGIISSYTDAVRYQHTGFVRDANDGIWKLFANVVAEPTTTVDFTNATYSNLLVGNILARTILAPTYIGTNASFSGYVNTVGNILSTGAIHNSLTVNGSANITGFSNITIASGSADSALVIMGNVSRGGASYHDFLRVTSTASGVINPNMNFRLNGNGNLQIINSGYSAQLFELQQSGNIVIAGALNAGGSYGTVGQLLQSTGTGIAWTAPTAGSQVSSGTSNVAVLSSGGNVVISIGGSIIANVGTSGLTVIGGISAGSITGNGAALTGLPAGYSNVNAATFLASGTLATAINTAGNVIAAAFIGNGAGLTGLSAGYSNVNAATFLASGTLTTAISTSGNITVGNILPTANNVSNIGSSSSRFRIVHAQATQAQYADLAEVYTSDQQYPAGTVVVFGGEAEVTQSRASHDTRIAGVVSTNPAYLMNSTETGMPVALQGRVPCRVLGPVSQGDRVVSSHIAGVAQALDPLQYQPGCIIGKALQTVESTDISIIEVVVGRV